jgi:cytochrome c553
MKKNIRIVISSLIFLVASFIISPSFAGDKQKGASLVKEKNCASCHGADFNKTASPDYPKLAGQKEDYLYYALSSYKSTNPQFGRSNPIMQGQAKSLSNKDMKDIASYLSSLPSTLVMKK